MRGRGNVRNVGNRAAGEIAEANEEKEGINDTMREQAERRTAQRSTVPSFRTFPTFLTSLRRIAGMPDYRAHVEHLRRCHPESPIPSEREFFEDYLQRRYQNGATRCC